MSEEAVGSRLMEDLPQPLVGAMMSAMLEATLECTREQPKQAELYRKSGFQMLWEGLRRRG